MKHFNTLNTVDQLWMCLQIKICINFMRITVLIIALKVRNSFLGSKNRYQLNKYYF